MLFKKDWNKPGPGVPKDLPVKKGMARFVELFLRHFSKLMLMNFLCLIFILGPVVAFYFSGVYFMQGNVMMGFLLLLCFIAACLPLGAATTSFYYLFVQMLRNESFFFWHDWGKIYRENFKKAIVPGIGFGLFLGSGLFVWLMGDVYINQLPVFFYTLYLFASIIWVFMLPIFFVQMAFMDLPVHAILRNSFLLGIGTISRSLPGAILGSGLLLLQMVFFPFSLPILLFLGISLPMLIQMLWVWPKIDNTFKIDETLKKRREDQWNTEQK